MGQIQGFSRWKKSAALSVLGLCSLGSFSVADAGVNKSPYSQSSSEIMYIVTSLDLAKILGPKRSIDAILRVNSGYTVISEECTVNVIVEPGDKPGPLAATKFTYGPLVCGE